MKADEEASCPARQRIAATSDLGYSPGSSVVLESAEVALQDWGVSSDDGPMGLGSALVESIQKDALATQCPCRRSTNQILEGLDTLAAAGRFTASRIELGA